jgi:hypothetical protein
MTLYDITLDEIAEHTENYSNSDLVCLIKEIRIALINEAYEKQLSLRD